MLDARLLDARLLDARFWMLVCWMLLIALCKPSLHKYHLIMRYFYFSTLRDSSYLSSTFCTVLQGNTLIIVHFPTFIMVGVMQISYLFSLLYLTTALPCNQNYSSPSVGRFGEDIYHWRFAELCCSPLVIVWYFDSK